MAAKKSNTPKLPRFDQYAFLGALGCKWENGQGIPGDRGSLFTEWVLPLSFFAEGLLYRPAPERSVEWMIVLRAGEAFRMFIEYTLGSRWNVYMTGVRTDGNEVRFIGLDRHGFYEMLMTQPQFELYELLIAALKPFVGTDPPT